MTDDTLSTPGFPFSADDWFDPLEEAVRQSIRGFIEATLEAELEAALGRRRYQRRDASGGYRNGRRARHLIGSFGSVAVSVPRARLFDGDGRSREWRSATLPAYQRLTKRAEALIASAYLAGINTRRVRRALASLFGGAVSKDTVSRAWHKLHSDWEAWQARNLAGDEITRLILDGTVVKVRLDRRVTAISILIAIGVRRDGSKVVLAIRNMGGESEAAWRAVLDDLVARNLGTPELLIVDGAPGLEAAIAALWPTIPVQRCTVHKERNLLAHAPKRMHEEIKADYNAMMYADGATAVLTKRRAFLAKWRLKCPAVARSLEEAGERLFTFTAYPKEQWKSLRTTNAIERLHEEFKRRIKTQCTLPSAETACMLLWALLASGQITLRRVDGWRTLQKETTPIDLAA
ncbi:MAG: IS256 family transposase [Acidiferrobacterales bacterium]